MRLLDVFMHFSALRPKRVAKSSISSCRVRTIYIKTQT